MNIFKILSSYDGSINEPNISAMLAYLLNPYKDHGIGYTFLNEIIKHVLKDNTKGSMKETLENYLKNYLNYKIEIIPEFSVDTSEFHSKSRRDIDIVIEFYEAPYKEEIPKFAICIENKIYNSSFSDYTQFYCEITGLRFHYGHVKLNYTHVYFLLICPEMNEKFKKGFEKMKMDNPSFIQWYEGDNSIVKILNYIMYLEKEGNIDPISTELNYLIKSFISFIKNDFKSIDIMKIETERRDYGKPVIDYLKDVYDEMEYDNEYSIKEIKEYLSKIIKNNSGTTLRDNTRNAHIYKVIVNDKNRIHYGAKEPFDEKINLFYYVDENDKKFLKKFKLDIDENINIYYLEDGVKETIKLFDLKKQKYGA